MTTNNAKVLVEMTQNLQTLVDQLRPFVEADNAPPELASQVNALIKYASIIGISI